MKYKDYYAALGVPREAELEQIKKAYRKLARKHHPDMSKAPDAEEKFKEAQEAYATLKDPEKRAAYDELGRRPQGQDFAPPPEWAQHHAFEGGFDNINLADLLAAMGRAGSGGQRQAHPMPGRDFEATVQIGLEDAHRGRTLQLEIPDGEGTRTIEVTIPAGVSDGQKLRLRGQGAMGRNGGPRGDIYLHVALARHPVFRADGHDLLFDLTLAPWEAVLGAEVEVPTLEGPVVLTVPAGSRSGRKLRLRGRGLASKHGGRGDLYALLDIDVPATLTPRERELFSELAKTSTFNPRVALKEAVDEHPT